MSAAAPGAPLSPVALLRQLDRWLDASQHDAAHPWRQSITATLAAHGAEGAAAADAELFMRPFGDALWSLQAVILAASAYAAELGADGPIEDDGIGLLRRVMRNAAREAERLALKVAGGPASWGEA